MLKTILMVTIMASDLLQVERAYRDELGYRVARRGAVPGALAAAWNAATLAGRDYVIMQPSSNEPVYLRFIEDTSGAAAEPMKTEGWNAVEILVQDPDALAPALERSGHFNVVGRPRYLTEKQNIKAMQAVGPANELVYFTNISDPEKSGFGLQPARTYIDRVFIMVAGARDHSALGEFYRTVLGMTVTAPGAVPYRHVVQGLRHAGGDQARTVDSAVVGNDSWSNWIVTPKQLCLEMPFRVHCLPEIAMVTFEVTEWNPDLPYIVAPAMQSSFPYLGRRAAVLVGAAGEYIELVESASTEP